MSDVILILLSLLGSAFCSGIEIAFLTANKLKIELDKKQGVSGANILSYFQNKPKYFIASMLIGNNIALVIFGLKFGGALEGVLANFLDHQFSIILIQTLVSTLVVLIFGEFIPKAIFSSNPNVWLSRLAFPLTLWYGILFVFAYLFTKLSNAVIMIITRDKLKETPIVFGATDLNHFMENATGKAPSASEIDLEIQFFQNALDFKSVKARDCMVPRNEIVSIEVDTPIAQMKEKFIETKLSKILVHRDSLDQLIGYVHFSDCYKSPSSILSAIRPIAVIPEAMPANDILRIFKKDKKSVAVVVDEFGSTSGLITFEDIIEEILGEIEDEHDTSEFIELQLESNVFDFSGRLDVKYINEKYRLNLPESDEDYDTLAGLILHIHQGFPNENEIIQSTGFQYTILEMNSNKIE
ncbi:MAG: hemolysin family protein, partial [Bacteroidota bacterium]